MGDLHCLRHRYCDVLLFTKYRQKHREAMFFKDIVQNITSLKNMILGQPTKGEDRAKYRALTSSLDPGHPGHPKPRHGHLKCHLPSSWTWISSLFMLSPFIISSFHPQSLVALATHCPGLVTLECAGLSHFTDAGFQVLLDHLYWNWICSHQCYM